MPSYVGLKPASAKASAAARGSSKKSGTTCELLLRRELWRRGLRFRVAAPGLPGRPDLVFTTARVVVFCDGDYWHGRGLASRVRKLAKGHNAPYWIAKIRANVARDRLHARKLRGLGWTVLRFWESRILGDPRHVADLVELKVRRQRMRRK